MMFNYLTLLQFYMLLNVIFSIMRVVVDYLCDPLYFLNTITLTLLTIITWYIVLILKFILASAILNINFKLAPLWKKLQVSGCRFFFCNKKYR